MQTYHVKTIVSDEGILTIEGLPFLPGEKVEVIVKSQSSTGKNQNLYPLRGKPIKYKEPFESVGEADWGIMNDPT